MDQLDNLKNRESYTKIHLNTFVHINQIPGVHIISFVVVFRFMILFCFFRFHRKRNSFPFWLCGFISITSQRAMNFKKC